MGIENVELHETLCSLARGQELGLDTLFTG